MSGVGVRISGSIAVKRSARAQYEQIQSMAEIQNTFSKSQKIKQFLESVSRNVPVCLSLTLSLCTLFCHCISITFFYELRSVNALN